MIGSLATTASFLTASTCVAGQLSADEPHVRLRRNAGAIDKDIPSGNGPRSSR
jgi:hypothetical protein